MLTMRFARMRALVGVTVLSLALVAGIVGTTEPAEARSNLEGICYVWGGDMNWEWYWFAGEVYGKFTCTLSNGTVIQCTEGPEGDILGCSLFP